MLNLDMVGRLKNENPADRRRCDTAPAFDGLLHHAMQLVFR